MKDGQLRAGTEGGFDGRCAPYLRAAEDRHFWFRARNAILRPLIRQTEATLDPGYRILEVGCGTGNTLRLLDALCTRGSVFGMDFQREGLRFARERMHRPLIQGDVREAPFAPWVRFNLIAMFDVLEHIEDDLGTLAAVRSWLAPEGVLLLTVPAGSELWSDFDVAAGHCRRYSAAELKARLLHAGFRIEYLSPMMASLYPLVWTARRVTKRLRPKIDPFETALDELRVVPVVNWLALWMLRREVPLVAGRWQFPFGTSLVAIVRRPGDPGAPAG